MALTSPSLMCQLALRLDIFNYASACDIQCVADKDALLSYEGLATVESFWGRIDRARGLYQEGQAKHGGTSRFYRSWAQLEKKQGQLEVHWPKPKKTLPVPIPSCPPKPTFVPPALQASTPHCPSPPPLSAPPVWAKLFLLYAICHCFYLACLFWL